MKTNHRGPSWQTNMLGLGSISISLLTTWQVLFMLQSCMHNVGYKEIFILSSHHSPLSYYLTGMFPDFHLTKYKKEKFKLTGSKVNGIGRNSRER